MKSSHGHIEAEIIYEKVRSDDIIVQTKDCNFRVKPTILSSEKIHLFLNKLCCGICYGDQI